MPTFDPIAEVLQRQLLLRRYENTLAQLTRARMDTLRRTLVELLQRYDPTGLPPARQIARLELLARRTDEALLEAYRDLHATVRDRLVDLGAVQGERAAQTLLAAARTQGLELSLPLLTRSRLRAIVTTDPIRGETLWGWWKYQRVATKTAFTRQLRIGLLQGEAIDDLVRRIRGRAIARGQYVGGVMEVSTRQAEALVRTAVNQVATTAQVETGRLNDDIVSSYEYVATLDTRTTLLCASLDGRVFRFDDPKAKKPPQHWNALATGTPIRTRTGVRTIERVAVGDEVWTHAGRWARVYAVMGKPCRDGWLRELRCASGRRLWATDDHPVLTSRGWALMGQVQVGTSSSSTSRRGPRARTRLVRRSSTASCSTRTTVQPRRRR